MTDKPKEEISGCFPQAGYSIGIQSIDSKALGGSFSGVALTTYNPATPTTVASSTGDNLNSCFDQPSWGFGMSAINIGAFSFTPKDPF